MNRRVVVLGAGVIGLCTAYYAALEGHDVLVVERESEHHEGCSYGNAGLIVPSHIVPLAAPGMVGLALRWMWNPESPFYVKPRFDGQLFSWAWKFLRAANARRAEAAAPIIRDLNLQSRALFEELANRSADAFGLVKKGVVLLCNTQQGLDEEAANARKATELGLNVTVLDLPQTRALEPGLDMNIVGAVHYLQDAHMDPGKFMATLRRLAAEAGVRTQWNTTVRGWKANGRRVKTMLTNGNEIESDEFVLCGGSWSGETVAGLDVKLPLQAGKGYHFTLSQPPVMPGMGAILVEGRVAVTPMGDRLRFAGTMELDGLNERINPARLNGIRKTALRYYPQFKESDFADATIWCGLRPCSPDGLPFVGRLAAYENLSVACGHAMMGLSLGPITGKLLAEILSGRTPSQDLSLLNPDRYRH